MKILTIIIAYNFEKWITRCIHSLEKSDMPTDILVIDNLSTDNTVQIIKTQYPKVRLICNSQNLGFGQANNIGLQIALQENYDAVFLLNQDAWIDSQVLSTLAELYQKNPSLGILSPIHLDGSGTKLDFGFYHYTGNNNNLLSIHTHQWTECPFINAAFWFIPRKTLLTVGGFSPLFYHYGEDKDYINRLHFHQLSIGYCTGVFGCHDRAQRTVSHQTFLHSEYVYLLSECTNINYSLIKAFLLGCIGGYKKALSALFKGNIATCFDYCKLSNKLILHYPQYIRIRKLTKSKFPHFIKL